MELKFKADTKHRKDWFTGVSFSHPAKMSLPLQQWIIENYTKAGETILDPMAGSGTVLVACSLGRNVIAVELEQKFIDIMKGNWEKIKQRGAQLGYAMGDCQIIQGDARQLEGLLVDKCIFSPPFSTANPRDKYHFDDGYVADMMSRSYVQGKINSSDNISLLPYGQIDKIVTSPPYGNPRDIDDKSEKDYEDKRLGEQDKQHGRTQFRGRYEVDSIITSPPYEGTLQEEPSPEKIERRAKYFEETDMKHGRRVGSRHTPGRMKHLGIVGARYSGSEDNIGNLKSQSYLEAMLQVYQNCFAVLRDSGLLILVTKNFIRQKQVVRLDLDTIKLCEQAGFSFLERHYRKLPSQSFWRVIYKQKFPDVETIDFEDILVLKKA